MNVGASDHHAIWRGDRPGEALLDVVAKRVVFGELGDLGPLGASIGMPLRSCGPILETAAMGRCVAPELSRDRRWRTAELGSDLAYPTTSCVEDGDLFSLDEGQIATGKWSEADGWHTTTLTEQPRTNSRRQADGDRGVLARKPASDRVPELLEMLPAPSWRATR